MDWSVADNFPLERNKFQQVNPLVEYNSNHSYRGYSRVNFLHHQADLSQLPLVSNQNKRQHNYPRPITH